MIYSYILLLLKKKKKRLCQILNNFNNLIWSGQIPCVAMGLGIVPCLNFCTQWLPLYFTQELQQTYDQSLANKLTVIYIFQDMGMWFSGAVVFWLVGRDGRIGGILRNAFHSSSTTTHRCHYFQIGELHLCDLATRRIRHLRNRFRYVITTA